MTTAMDTYEATIVASTTPWGEKEEGAVASLGMRSRACIDVGHRRGRRLVGHHRGCLSCQHRPSLSGRSTNSTIGRITSNILEYGWSTSTILTTPRGEKEEGAMVSSGGRSRACIDVVHCRGHRLVGHHRGCLSCQHRPSSSGRSTRDY